MSTWQVIEGIWGFFVLLFLNDISLQLRQHFEKDKQV